MSAPHLHRSRPHGAHAPSWLICLDLQRDFVVPGRPHYTPASAAVATACIRVLQHARTSGWRVVHSQRRRGFESAFGGTLFGAPIEGLRPLISEPIFMRRSLSAFSEPEFAAELRRARADHIYLVGFSLADTCLATTLAAADHGLSLILIEDALGGVAADGAPAWPIARSILSPFARFVSSDEIRAPAGELAL